MAADRMPDWYRGPGMYLATELNTERFAWMGWRAIDPIEANRVFITTSDDYIYGRIPFTGFAEILKAEKIDNPSYYDFIVRDGADLLGKTPRLFEFIQFNAIKREIIAMGIITYPPPDVAPQDMAKIGAMLMWYGKNLHGGILGPMAHSPERNRQCHRDVELATSHTLKMKALKALRDARGTYDMDAARANLPHGLRPDFDKYVASDAHMKSAR
jgi:hypothetical protein